AGHTLHMQKAMEQMNVKLAEVVSDVCGATGRRIIEAILAGERDPNRLAALRDVKGKRDAAAIARALEGTWRPAHLCPLRAAGDLARFHHRQIDECDAAIRAELARLPDRSGGRPLAAKPRRCGRKANDLSFDAAGPLLRAVGVDLTEVEGIDARTALVILAEVGADVGRFPTEKHFASWLGVCPRQHESNGVRKRRGAAEGEDPGGGGAADGGPGGGPDPVPARAVLPPDQGADRGGGGGDGDGPQAGPAGVPDAPSRDGVREAVDGRVRGAAAGAAGAA